MCNEKSKSWKWFDFELQGSRRPKANEELLAIEIAWFWHFLCFPHKEGAGAGSSNSVWFLTFLMFFTRARKVQVQVALTQLIAWLERHGLHFLPTSERYKQCKSQSWKSCDKKAKFSDISTDFQDGSDICAFDTAVKARKVFRIWHLCFWHCGVVRIMLAPCKANYGSVWR